MYGVGVLCVKCLCLYLCFWPLFHDFVVVYDTRASNSQCVLMPFYNQPRSYFLHWFISFETLGNVCFVVGVAALNLFAIIPFEIHPP